jgi:hypothetical protein
MTETTATYRAGMPTIPDRLRSRPIQNGYPVPWFAIQIDGVYDFRIVDKPRIGTALKEKLCWCCGQKMGAYKAFLIGPMCAVNRVISEPPSHRDCAEWTAKVCPFLAQRQEFRRDINLDPKYSVHLEQPPGNAIMRQPGATCLWITKSFRLLSVSNGLLFDLGEPTEVLWFKEGRPATRAEVLESIESGYPILLDMARQEGAASVRELERMKTKAMELIPNE